MLGELTSFIVDTVGSWGYLGIFIMMAIESSFIPFPSEIVMIPAGYLASKGEMNLVLILFSGFGGSMIGAWINYFLAMNLGRKFLYAYGQYFFMKESTLDKMETFFKKHGAVSTFTGRLIPGIRQLISIPAGLSKMSFPLFSLYTFLGAAIWSTALVLLGYFLGENEEMMKDYVHEMVYIALSLVGLIILVYTLMQKRTQG
ncbi:DedA family protein [Sulfurimonas sp. MAG313]|nr:DedA family protein [Sulfurimonas sp. MAG313]MDF1881726.1 DedA family protein [Sulfurimonas sp. MAG313]